MKASRFSERTGGSSYAAFFGHPGYRRMFAPDRLTLGIFLPLRSYSGDMSVLRGQSDLVAKIDSYGFAAVWVRDVPLFDASFGDAGQVFDPFTYLSYLAARTQKVALATGSAVISLRHPIDLAKAATTIDQLSGGRLVMGWPLATGRRSFRPTGWSTVPGRSAFPRRCPIYASSCMPVIWTSIPRWGALKVPSSCPSPYPQAFR
ncbi:hypothetical protein CtCNB1_2550 [Comamonas thiooxydans]|nr:hypothetical protein CtCNB1_2550 [Comamonas thiooxydans]